MSNLEKLELEHKANKKADEIIECLEISLGSIKLRYTHTQLLELAFHVAMSTRKEIPMYLGNLNPLWNLYNKTATILRYRIDKCENELNNDKAALT